MDFGGEAFPRLSGTIGSDVNLRLDLRKDMH